MRCWGALIVVFALLAVHAAGASAAEPCTPFEVRSTDTDLSTANAMPQLTEYLKDGAYRVTSCDAEGKPLVMIEAAPHFIRDIGLRHVPSMAIVKTGGLLFKRTTGYPRLSHMSRQRARYVRKLLRELPAPADRKRVKRETERAAKDEVTDGSDDPLEKASAAKRRRNPDNACRRGAFSAGLSRWRSSFVYYTRNSSTRIPEAVPDVVAAHNVWNAAINPCGLARTSKAIAIYGGVTEIAASRIADGVNVIDVGSVEELGCPGALACTLTWSSVDNPGVTIESDMRFDRSYPWSRSGRRGRYDIRSVATHEAGHSMVGLNDLYSRKDQWLTMYGYVDRGKTRKRSLGRGDVLGLRAVYP